MATFKVGQRVRIIDMPSGVIGKRREILGAEGVIVAIPSMGKGDCDVGIPAHPAASYGYAPEPWAARFWQLAPLTDLPAEKFIETVKSWGPLHEEPRIDVEYHRRMERGYAEIERKMREYLNR